MNEATQKLDDLFQVTELLMIKSGTPSTPVKVGSSCPPHSCLSLRSAVNRELVTNFAWHSCGKSTQESGIRKGCGQGAF